MELNAYDALQDHVISYTWHEMLNSLSTHKRLTEFICPSVLRPKISYKMAALKRNRFHRIRKQTSHVLLTLLSPALAELLTSFPFSLFLLLDLDFVIFSSNFFTKIELTAIQPTPSGNDLPFP